MQKTHLRNSWKHKQRHSHQSFQFSTPPPKGSSTSFRQVLRQYWCQCDTSVPLGLRVWIWGPVGGFHPTYQTSLFTQVEGCGFNVYPRESWTDVVRIQFRHVSRSRRWCTDLPAFCNSPSRLCREPAWNSNFGTRSFVHILYKAWFLQIPLLLFFSPSFQNHWDENLKINETKLTKHGLELTSKLFILKAAIYVSGAFFPNRKNRWPFQKSLQQVLPWQPVTWASIPPCHCVGL